MTDTDSTLSLPEAIETIKRLSATPQGHAADWGSYREAVDVVLNAVVADQLTPASRRRVETVSYVAANSQGGTTSWDVRRAHSAAPQAVTIMTEGADGSTTSEEAVRTPLREVYYERSELLDDLNWLCTVEGDEVQMVDWLNVVCNVLPRTLSYLEAGQ